MQSKTIEIILKVVEIIANIFVSSRKNKGGYNNDSTGIAKKK
jgi:hypothetical protein